ncbi:hypothetical protein [Weissella paramesenteroides]|uniref:hypothetical protein n=1 Tax=Weissella paramesenteroides TaxID=1249 RepID=UPI0023F83E4F|nr:hypothetical protein [Weissella paramesenteroides]MDF8372513.1 hypothetical protein [Weissella paramesenteroides]WIG66292.1 hypothetical protein G9U56_04725 [Weissella paramesenteroides]
MADTGQRPKMRDNDISFFLNVLPNTIKATLNVAQLGKVTRLYDDNKKAEVQPLALSSDETPRARLIGVHVGKLSGVLLPLVMWWLSCLWTVQLLILMDLTSCLNCLLTDYTI